jgi:CheY-like chemotaxis protein
MRMTDDVHVSGRTEIDLIRRQLDGLAAWHRARRAAERAGMTDHASREARADHRRRLDVMDAEHRAIVERVEFQLRASVHPLAGECPPRAVLAHRNPWFLTKVSSELLVGDVQIAAAVTDGAQAVGVVVAEQPDLLLVEDPLPMLASADVVRKARSYAPTTLVVAQVAYDERIPVLLDAGAALALSRRVTPAQVALETLELLRTRARVPARV